MKLLAVWRVARLSDRPRWRRRSRIATTSRQRPLRAERQSEAKSPLSAAEAAQLAEVLDRVQREYVDTVSHPELVDDALRGLVGGLDPYSSYLDAEEYADLRVSTAGTYCGHRHRSIDRRSRAARRAPVPGFAGRGRRASAAAT